MLANLRLKLAGWLLGASVLKASLTFDERDTLIVVPDDSWNMDELESARRTISEQLPFLHVLVFSKKVSLMKIEH